jgi:hypothetical protein
MADERAAQPAPRVFISYSHDSDAHSGRVLALAEALKRQGLQVILDQYEPHPAEGWILWMEKNLTGADYVLMICTPTYVRRILGEEEDGKGQGIYWEVGRLIYNLLYMEKAAAHRFIPVLFEDASEHDIPVPLRQHQHYRIHVFDSSDAGYIALYRHLTGRQSAARAGRSAPAHRHPRAESVQTDSLRWYLEAFLKQMRDLLDGTIILPMKGSPSQVRSLFHARASPIRRHPVAGEEAPEESCTYESFEEAFRALGGRVLLLGAPGAGKTNTLLQFAIRTAEERLRNLEDRTRPIPLFERIYHWDGQLSLKEWAQTDVRAHFPALDLDAEPLIYLFDGLDELGSAEPSAPGESDSAEDPRRTFLTALSADLPGERVIISCREFDYEQIGEKVGLQGAVTLLPLRPEQIEQYLLSHYQPALWQVLQNDASLLELVQTPLLLVLLSLAVEEEGSSGIELAGLTESGVFDLYITRRFEHERARGDLPFEEEVTREKLGRIAASMWRNPWGPRVSVVRAELNQLLHPQSQDFLSFAISMHLLRRSPEGEIGFLHLKLRDYCAIPRLLATLGDRDPEIRMLAADILDELNPDWRDLVSRKELDRDTA